MKYFVTLHTGYCGSDAHELLDLPDDMSEDDICDLTWEMALENASSYGIEMCHDECEDDDCDYEHPGSTNISGHAVPYVPKEHDMYLT